PDALLVPLEDDATGGDAVDGDVHGPSRRGRVGIRAQAQPVVTGSREGKPHDGRAALRPPDGHEAAARRAAPSRAEEEPVAGAGGDDGRLAGAQGFALAQLTERG